MLLSQWSRFPTDDMISSLSCNQNNSWNLLWSDRLKIFVFFLTVGSKPAFWFDIWLIFITLKISRRTRIRSLTSVHTMIISGCCSTSRVVSIVLLASCKSYYAVDMRHFLVNCSDYQKVAFSCLSDKAQSCCSFAECLLTMISLRNGCQREFLNESVSVSKEFSWSGRWGCKAFFSESLKFQCLQNRASFVIFLVEHFISS